MTPRGWPPPPEGFVVVPAEGGALYVAANDEREARARGLTSAAGWNRTLGAGAHEAGRGATTVIGAPGERLWRLKAMRRGGALAPLWRDRYPGAARPVATLAATVSAASRGIPTARPIALLVTREASGLSRGYLATEELVGFEDLARRTRRGAVTSAEIGAAMSTVRGMHDRGIAHCDLNLGNILTRDGGAHVAIIDFDRARVSAGPVPFGAREAAIRRLERSCAKLIGSPGPLGKGSEDLWYDAYAGEDREMAARFARGRGRGRLALSWHRLGWRRARR